MATTTQERTARELEHATMLGGDAMVGAAPRVMGDLTELSISAAKESARLTAEVQMAAIDAFRESQASLLRWQALWPEALTDPHLYQKAFVETVDTAQRALLLLGTNARIVAQSIDRLQTSAMDTGRRLRDTLTSAPARETPRRG
jgi:hypothetical protein